MDQKEMGQFYTEVAGQKARMDVRCTGRERPFLFLACVNDVWKNCESNIGLFADGCAIRREIANSNDVDKLQTGDWAVGNGMKINQGKSKAISFTRARVKDPLNYSLLYQVIAEVSSWEYLEIIIRKRFKSD